MLARQKYCAMTSSRQSECPSIPHYQPDEDLPRLFAIIYIRTGGGFIAPLLPGRALRHTRVLSLSSSACRPYQSSDLCDAPSRQTRHRTCGLPRTQPPYLSMDDAVYKQVYGTSCPKGVSLELKPAPPPETPRMHRTRGYPTPGLDMVGG